MSNERCNSGKIFEADCVHEGGKFILCNPGGRHHRSSGLFTVRFRAPADYQAGSVFSVRGKEVPVLTPGMQAAPAGAFRAGAVMHADIDLACGRAFVGASGSGGGIGAESAIVPDYAAQDSANQMPADGSSFTVPADGFVVVSRDGHPPRTPSPARH